jgi:membrane protein DedA with SNARE-associated domain
MHSLWKFVLSFVLIVMAVPLVPFALFGGLPGETWVEHPDAAYVFCMGVLLLAGDIFLPVPSSVVAVFVGAKLGLVGGALAVILGLNLGTVLGYMAGWYAGYPLVSRYASPAQRDFIHELQGRLGYLALATMRSVPVLGEASVLAAGAARWSPRPILTILIVANGGLAMVYAFFGATGLAESSPSLLLIGGVGVPVLGVLFTFLGHWLLEVFQKRRDTKNI